MTKQRSGKSIPPVLADVQAVVRRGCSRLALQSVVDACVIGLRWGAAATAGWILAWRILGQSPQTAWWGMLWIVAGVVAAMLVKREPVPGNYYVAKYVDEELGLHDRLAGGYDLLLQARSPTGLPDDPFIALALEEVERATVAARKKTAIGLRLPPRLLATFLWLGLPCLLPFVIFPSGRVIESLAMTDEQMEKAQEMKDALAMLAGEIESLDDLKEDEKQEVLKVLQNLDIKESDLKKMSQNDLFRKLAEAGIKIKGTGAKGAKIAKVLEEQQRKIMQLDLIKKQMAELQRHNQQESKIDLGDGTTMTTGKVKMMATDDLDLSGALARAVRAPGEAEKEYQNRLAMLEAHRQAEEARIGKFIAKGAKLGIPKTASEKFAAMMSEDKNYQERVLNAVKNPDSEEAKKIKKMFQKSLESELENENIPRGVGHMLKKYMQ